MYGKIHTDEVRKKISEINKGRQSHNKGKKLSDKTKQKISEAAKLKTGEKNAFYGKNHSEESIQKIKEKNKGRLPPNTTKISIDGNIYISMTEASRQLNIPTPTILWRIKSKNSKFSNYEYVKDNIFMPPSEILLVDDVDNYVSQNPQLDSH
jgi:group I intron endonuclease